jgi:hypothetical protein
VARHLVVAVLAATGAAPFYNGTQESFMGRYGNAETPDSACDRYPAPADGPDFGASG